MSSATGTGAVVDDIDRHMSEAGSIDRAAGPLGVYLAWCVNLSLVSDAFVAEHESELVRLKMRDMRPGEFLIRAAAGTLEEAHLTEAGQDFTRRYYPRYIDDYAGALGVAPEAVYGVADSWQNYDRIAPELTRQLYRPERATRTLADWWRDFRGRHDG